ncbi:hypothetical protein KC734_17220 [candidate division KSB1 bacterium]|nr:hypothetical protein [candidate division KSB1 bacterium]
MTHYSNIVSPQIQHSIKKQSFLSLLPTILCTIIISNAHNVVAQQSPAIQNLTKIFAISDSSRTFSLADSFIVVGSEMVWLNERLLQAERDYRIAYFAARMTLQQAPSPGDTLKVSYQRANLPLQREYALRTVQRTEPATGRADSALAQTRLTRLLERSLPTYGADLQKSGSLTRGVSIGTSQGLKVESGLRLQIAGKIAEDVEVVAALSDQNIPIQPEGNTQTLQEIDNVFIQLNAKKFNATLGDFQLAFSGTEFARYQRKLQGARATTTQGKAQLTLFGAVSRGKYNSMEIAGIEGKQGPYQLTGDRGQIDIIVLAGTERVWVDGEEMLRGENNDYVIEYGNGQLTFTRKRLITGNSRITVDFQYSDERFERTLSGGEASWGGVDDKLQVRATVLRESDDKDDPLGLALDDDLLDVLANAGDSLAYIDGATFVGTGQGSYQKQDSFFVYVGTDSGEYRVRFSDFGVGQGSYDYTGFGRYIYVGPGQGRYLPLVLLPKAQRNDLADVRLDFAPAKNLRLTTEFASSSFDDNLYSSAGDADNRGGAYFVHFDFSPEKMSLFGKSLGKGLFRLKYRHRGERYREIDRENVVEFGRKWDLGDAQFAAGSAETISEAEFRLEPWRDVRFFGAAGALDREAQNVSSSRWELGTEWARPDRLDLRYRIESIARDDANTQNNEWLRQRGTASRKIWRLRPLFELESETKKEAPIDSTLRAGFRFLDYAVGLGYESGQHLRAQAKFATRTDDDRFDQTFRERSISNTQSYSLSLQNWHNLQAEISYIHRQRDFSDSLSQNSRTDLAEVRIGYQNWQRAVQVDARYQITNSQVNRQERVFLPVREGDGNYRFDEDLGEFVSDPFGDFILRLVPTEDFLPVAELRSRFNLRLRPNLAYRKLENPSRWQKMLSALSSETTLRIEEKSRDPEVSEIYLFNFSHFQNSEFTLFGTIALTQDFYLFENQRNFSLRYRLASSKDLNNQFLEGEQRRRQIQHELRLNTALSAEVAGQVELIRNIEDRRFAQAGRADRLVCGWRGEGDLSWRPRSRLEMALKGIFGVDRDEAQAPATKVTRVTLKPRAVYSFSGRGQFRGELDFTEVRAEPGNRVIPFELAQGNRVGRTFRWDVSFIYRVSTNLQASLSYQGRNEPHRPRTLHIAKAEVRAFF